MSSRHLGFSTSTSTYAGSELKLHAVPDLPPSATILARASEMSHETPTGWPKTYGVTQMRPPLAARKSLSAWLKSKYVVTVPSAFSTMPLRVSWSGRAPPS